MVAIKGEGERRDSFFFLSVVHPAARVIVITRMKVGAS